MRNFALIILVTLIAGGVAPCWSQSRSDLPTFFKNYAGLSQEQIEEIQHGRTIAKIVESPTPDEVLVFGAVYIEATPESYLELAGDIDELRKLPSFSPSENSVIHQNCLTWTVLVSKKTTSGH